MQLPSLPSFNHDMWQSLIGGLAAGLGYVMALFAEAQNLIPQSIWEGGITVIVISGLAYAVFHLWRALRKVEEQRVADRDSMITFLQTDISRAHESREKLHKTIDRNSEALETLVNKLNDPRTGPIKLRSPHEND